MTLADVTLPVPLSEARPLAMVFTKQLAVRLAELHLVHGSANLVPSPVALSDGRLALSADLLTEVMPGGLLHAMWEAADKAVLLPAVEVLPWSAIENVIPPQPVGP